MQIVNKSNDFRRSTILPFATILFIIIGLPFLALADTTSSNWGAMLNSNDYNIRSRAAAEIPNAANLDTVTAINILINSLNLEIQTPFSYSREHFSGYPITEALKGQYSSSIQRLIKNNPQIIYPILDSTSGELHDRVIIILGNLGDTLVHEEIRHMAIENNNDYLRLRAVETLRIYSDTLDIPILIKALKDEFWISEFTNPETGNPVNVNHPIRTEAATILMKMGYDVSFKDGKYEVTKRK